jgi:hypothetical protein
MNTAQTNIRLVNALEALNKHYESTTPKSTTVFKFDLDQQAKDRDSNTISDYAKKLGKTYEEVEKKFKDVVTSAELIAELSENRKKLRDPNRVENIAERVAYDQEIARKNFEAQIQLEKVAKKYGITVDKLKTLTADEVKEKEKNIEATQRTATRFEKTFKAVTDVMKGATGIFKDVLNLGATDSLEAMKNISKVAVDSVASVTKSIASLAGPWAGVLTNLIDGVSNATKTAIDISINEFKTGWKSYSDLSSRGLTSSFEEMDSISTEMGLRYEDFSKVITKNSEQLAILGGTAVGGTKMFATLSSQTKNLRDDFARLGYNTVEFSELQSEYISQQIRLGRGRDINLAKSTSNYLEQLDLLARLTGKNTKDIQSEQAGFAADDRFAAMLTDPSMTPEKAAALNNTVSIFKSQFGDNYARGIMHLMSSDGIPTTKESQAVFVQLGGDVSAVRQLLGIKAPTMDDVVTTVNRTRRSMRNLREPARWSALYTGGDNLLTSDYANTVKGMGAGDITSDDIKKIINDVELTRSGANATTEALANINTNMHDSSTRLQRVATASDAVTGAFSRMTDRIDSVTEQLYELSGRTIPADVKDRMSARKDENSIRLQISQTQDKLRLKKEQHFKLSGDDLKKLRKAYEKEKQVYEDSINIHGLEDLSSKRRLNNLEKKLGYDLEHELKILNNRLITAQKRAAAAGIPVRPMNTVPVYTPSSTLEQRTQQNTVTSNQTTTNQDIPAYRKILEAISLAEGTDVETANKKAQRGLQFKSAYDVPLNYGGLGDVSMIKNKPLSQMTLGEVMAYQESMLRDPKNKFSGGKSSAVGKYQIVNKTLRGLIKNMGLSEDAIFDETLQDRMAVELLRTRGFFNPKMSVEQIQNSLAKEWESLPKYRSHLGDRGNKALIEHHKIESLITESKKGLSPRNPKKGVPVSENDNVSSKPVDSVASVASVTTGSKLVQPYKPTEYSDLSYHNINIGIPNTNSLVTPSPRNPKKGVPVSENDNVSSKLVDSVTTGSKLVQPYKPTEYSDLSYHNINIGIPNTNSLVTPSPTLSSIGENIPSINKMYSVATEKITSEKETVASTNIVNQPSIIDPTNINTLNSLFVTLIQKHDRTNMILSDIHDINRSMRRELA